MRRLSPGQQQVVRMRVMAALRDGMSDAEAARTFGVSRNLIRSWRSRFEADGVEGLVSGGLGGRRGSTTTLYLPGGTEVKVDNATGTKTGVRYYTHLGETIGMRTQTALTWLVPDHHNTADAAIHATSHAVTYRRMTPFGAPRGTQFPWQGDRGFVNGTMDSTTGLTHLGARELAAG